MVKSARRSLTEEKDRVCHAITESIALEPLPPADLTAALRDGAFAARRWRSGAAAPAVCLSFKMIIGRRVAFSQS